MNGAKKDVTTLSLSKGFVNMELKIKDGNFNLSTISPNRIWKSFLHMVFPIHTPNSKSLSSKFHAKKTKIYSLSENYANHWVV